jgi:OFA family oxalate/formate antiporter-like MFS transporter
VSRDGAGALAALPGPAPRWWLVGVAAVAMGAAGSFQFLWSSLRGPVGARVGAGETGLGTALTAFVIAQTLAGFPAGRYRDRAGPRLPLAVGAVLVIAGYAGVGAAPSLPLAIAAYAVGGIGAGCVYTVAINTPVKWFTERRGLATGVVTMAYGSASALLVGYVGPAAATDLPGTGLTLAALAGGACLLGVPVLYDPDEPADAGGDATPDGGGDAPDAGPRAVLATWQFWVLYGVFVVVNGVGLMLIGKVVGLATGLGLPASAGTLAASALAVADGAGIVLVGGLSDRFGRERTVAVALVGCGLALAGAVVVGAGSAPAFVALVAATTFLRAPTFAVFPSIVGDYYGAARSSGNYALLFTAKIPGGIFGGAAAGALIAGIGWTEAFLLGAGLLCLAGLATATLRPVQPSATTAENAP